MINESTFSKEWINGRSEHFKRGKKKASPELVEKVTKALHLLEGLSKSNLNFIFKGGTSLILLMEAVHRFSIDIDIIIEDKDSMSSLGEYFNYVIESSNIFYRYEENVRYSNKGIPKAHYKFFYKSALDDQEKYILLDILFEQNHYLQTVDKNIECEFIETNEPNVMVKMPSVNCILGDKLTAFAPNTTGIPYGVGKELEIIKQLFDIGNLFDSMDDINIVKDTFIVMAQQELEYRGLEEYTVEDVLNDIFETSSILAHRGAKEITLFNQLQRGVSTVKDFIFSRNYIIETALKDASKAAYLSLLLKNNITNIERYHQGIDLSEYTIQSQTFKNFKTIKKIDPEAYYYWYKCIELIEKVETT